MKGRLLTLLGAGVVVIALTALFKLVPVTATRADPKGAPSTPWGEPDLQGIWRDDYQVPLQRPAKYAGKEFFTDEERAALDKVRGAAPRFTDVGLAPRGSELDVAGAYNTVFTSIKPTGRRTSLIIDPPDGRIPSLTPEAKKRSDTAREFQLALLQATVACKNGLPGCQGGKYGPPSPRRADTPPHYVGSGGIAAGAINRADGPEDRILAERCMRQILPDFGAFLRIVQSPGSVAIFYDTGGGQGWNRVIPVSGTPHVPAHVRQWSGDSRGRWEGNTLVVDVTNFSPKADFQGSRENLHLVERFTRIDAKTLDYTVTIEDPTTWTRAWTVRQELNRQNERANRIYYEPRCHEGNYGLPGLLLGSRVEEKSFKEGRGPDPATRCSAFCGSGVEDLSDRDPLAN